MVDVVLGFYLCTTGGQLASSNRTMMDICLYITHKWLDRRYTIPKWILADQTTEEMAYKDIQSGTKGFSLNACAVSRYYMTVEYRKVCLWNLGHMVQVQTTGIVRVDLERPRMLSNLLENSWVNPLSCMYPLEPVCLFTASAASKDVWDDLVHDKTKGEDIPR